MEAKLKQVGEVSVVCISGPLEIGRAQFFRDICGRQNFGSKVIFNLENASFVGSTGIQPFLEAMRIVCGKSELGLKVVGLKNEFRRIFANEEIQGLEICDNETLALVSLDRGYAVTTCPMEPGLPPREGTAISDSTHD